MIEPNLVPLPRAPAKLGEMSPDKPPAYNRLYRAALDGEIAVVTIGNRLYLRETDLPQIAKLFGMKLRSEQVVA